MKTPPANYFVVDVREHVAIKMHITDENVARFIEEGKHNQGESIWYCSMLTQIAAAAKKQGYDFDHAAHYDNFVFVKLQPKPEPVRRRTLRERISHGR